MKVYIVIAQMVSDIERVFNTKKKAIEYLKSIGYGCLRKGNFYTHKGDKNWSFINDFYTIQECKVEE